MKSIGPGAGECATLRPLARADPVIIGTMELTIASALGPDRLTVSLLWEGVEKLGYELEKRVFPFEGLRRAICRADLDNE